jgi:hypothetical protein
MAVHVGLLYNGSKHSAGIWRCNLLQSFSASRDPTRVGGPQSLAAMRPFEDFHGRPVAANIGSIQVLQSKSIIANRLFYFPNNLYNTREDTC